MSEDKQDSIKKNEKINSSIERVEIEDEMKKSYLDYAMSVIVSRALPDIRDGLKPVHRRILYSMYDGNYDWNKPYRKSARIVGEVMGKFHPHGDSAIYRIYGQNGTELLYEFKAVRWSRKFWFNGWRSTCSNEIY